jgi:hypothetical protein
VLEYIDGVDGMIDTDLKQDLKEMAKRLTQLRGSL